MRAWLRTVVSPVRALQPTVTTWSWSNTAALPPSPQPEDILAAADAIGARVDDDTARAVERAVNRAAPRWANVCVRHDPCFITVSAKCLRCGAIFSTAWTRGLVDACHDAYAGAVARLRCYCVAREPERGSRAVCGGRGR